MPTFSLLPFLTFSSSVPKPTLNTTKSLRDKCKDGSLKETLGILHERNHQGLPIDPDTHAALLQSCVDICALSESKQVHAHILINGFEENLFLGFKILFEKIHEGGVIIWNSIIREYAKKCLCEEVLRLYYQMQQEGIKPNNFTFPIVLKACVVLSALKEGKEIHHHIIKNVFESGVYVCTSLVDMYSKCGCIEATFQVFEKPSKRDVVSWSAMIYGLAQNGFPNEALSIFQKMQLADIKPNVITTVSVLSACAHLAYLQQDYGIVPTLEHCACTIDLLGRVGHMKEMLTFIKQIPIEPDDGVWAALLSACRIHHNIKLGKNVAKHLIKLDPDNAANYVLFSNIYATAGRWDEVIKVRAMIKETKLKRSPGCSWIEVKNKFHSFFVRYRSHKQSEQIYSIVDLLVGKMKYSGYMPDRSFVLHNVE